MRSNASIAVMRKNWKKSSVQGGGQKVQKEIQNQGKEVPQYSWRTKLRLKVLKLKKLNHDKKKARLLNKEKKKDQKQYRKAISNLRMKELDMRIINNIVDKRMVRIIKRTDRSKYGGQATIDYFRALYTIEAIKDVCRKNSWTEKQDWDTHGVDMNKHFVNLFRAAEEYSKVKIYYEGLKHEQKARMYRA